MIWAVQVFFELKMVGGTILRTALCPSMYTTMGTTHQPLSSAASGHPHSTMTTAIHGSFYRHLETSFVDDKGSVQCEVAHHKLEPPRRPLQCRGMAKRDWALRHKKAHFSYEEPLFENRTFRFFNRSFLVSCHVMILRTTSDSSFMMILVRM